LTIGSGRHAHPQWRRGDGNLTVELRRRGPPRLNGAQVRLLEKGGPDQQRSAGDLLDVAAGGQLGEVAGDFVSGGFGLRYG
jgi:hypothetical protein